MEWFIIVPLGLLILIAIFIGFGLIKIILDNIVIILLVLAIFIIFLIFLFKKPIGTLAVTLVLGIIVLCVSCVGVGSRKNNIPVTISKATLGCYVYDIDGNHIHIPSGAIVARYCDENERVSEGHYFGFLSTCYWYYNGSTHVFTESVVSEKNKWALKQITEIPYKEFKKGNWINIDTIN